MKKYIKTMFSVATAALISLSLGVSPFAQTTDANGVNAASIQTAANTETVEDKTKTTYIFWDSSKGDDKADGSTADKAVKSLEKAFSVINKDNSDKAKASAKNSKNTDSTTSVKVDEDVKYVVVKCASAELTVKENEFIAKNNINVITASEYELILKAEKEASQSDTQKTEENTGKKDESVGNDKDVKEDSGKADGETAVPDNDKKTDEGAETTVNNDTSKESTATETENTSDKNVATENGNTADKNSEANQTSENNKTDINSDNTGNIETDVKDGVDSGKTDAIDENEKAESNSDIKVFGLKKFNKLIAVPAAVDLFDNCDNENEATASNSSDEIQALSLTGENTTMTAEVSSEDKETATADNGAINLLALPGNDLVGGGTKPIKKSDTQNQSASAASTTSKGSTVTAGGSSTGENTQSASAASGKNLQLAGGKNTSGKTGSVNTGDATDIASIAGICSLAAALAIIIALKCAKK